MDELTTDVFSTVPPFFVTLTSPSATFCNLLRITQFQIHISLWAQSDIAHSVILTRGLAETTAVADSRVSTSAGSSQDWLGDSHVELQCQPTSWTVHSTDSGLSRSGQVPNTNHCDCACTELLAPSEICVISGMSTLTLLERSTTDN